jgi:uncharacterized protein CbrC (UPF0167 family)
MRFDYFKGPETDMAMFEGSQLCYFCNIVAPAFALEFAICPLPEGERAGKFGCAECLTNGLFEFWHDTEIGLLDENGLQHVYNHNQEPPPDFSETALRELRRTPQIATWQQELWLTHCRDFMVYRGTWEPKDFYANAADGDGRALFLRMTSEYQHLWDESLTVGQAKLEEWYATYYVFHCRHCGALRGNWDCD